MAALTLCKVREATQGKGVDVVLEAASGEVGKESLKLAAPFARIVFFGAKNIHDTLSPETIQQLIYKNQTLRGLTYQAFHPKRSRRAFGIFSNSSPKTNCGCLPTLLILSPTRKPRSKRWKGARPSERSC